MTSFVIRPYGPTDASACIRVFDRAWHAGHPYAPRAIDAAVFETETKDETILVAEVGGSVVGFASLYAPDSFVHHLYVDPEHHGRGTGSALLARATALAGGRASLKCQTRNTSAVAFYRKLGWVEFAAGTGEFGSWVALRSPG